MAVLKHVNIHAKAQISRAMDRDVTMGIGPEAFADIHDVALSRIQGGSRALIERQSRIIQARTKDATEDPHSQDEGAGSKRSASSTPSKQRESMDAEQRDQIHENRESEAASETNSTTTHKNPKASRPPPNTSRAASKQASTPATAEAEDKDEVIFVMTTSVTPAIKRKASLSSKPESTSKRRKQAEDSEDEDKVETPSFKRSAVASNSKGGKFVKPSPKGQKQVEESEDDSEGSEDDESSENEDPQTLRQTLIKANKEFNSSCRACKTNANRTLKTKYETELKQLRKKSKTDLRNAKEKATKDARAVKTKADNDKDDLRARYEKQIKDLKESRTEKAATFNTKLEAWQTKYDEMKADLDEKNKKLTKERDSAEAKRKAIEKATNEEVRDMKNDMKADELLLKEERKQMRKEKDAEVSQLKPAHSALIKAKDQEIKNLTAEATSLREDLKTTNRDLRNARIDAAADRQRYINTKVTEEKAKSHASAVDENLREFERYLTEVERRRDLALAGLREKLDHERANSRDQRGRFVEEHRINLHLQGTLQQEVQKRKANDARVQALEAELSKMKADAGRA